MCFQATRIVAEKRLTECHEGLTRQVLAMETTRCLKAARNCLNEFRPHSPVPGCHASNSQVPSQSARSIFPHRNSCILRIVIRPHSARAKRVNGIFRRGARGGARQQRRHLYHDNDLDVDRQFLSFESRRNFRNFHQAMHQSPIRVCCITQFVSQVLPPSGENACSQRAACCEISDQM